jgi:hypothetical protein
MILINGLMKWLIALIWLHLIDPIASDLYLFARRGDQHPDLKDTINLGSGSAGDDLHDKLHLFPHVRKFSYF